MPRAYDSLAAAHADGWVTWSEAEAWALDNGVQMRVVVVDGGRAESTELYAPPGEAFARGSQVTITGQTPVLGGRYRTYIMFRAAELVATTEEEPKDA